jgi:hypothetical protein
MLLRPCRCCCGRMIIIETFAAGCQHIRPVRLGEGAAFDVAILSLTLTNDLATAGKIDPASRVAIARAGSGVSVPAGSPKPDVSTC